MRVAIRVRPGASRTLVGGSYAGALIVRVGAHAVDGQANIAALTALAQAFGVSKRAVTLVSGATSRSKVVEIEGGSAQTLAELLADQPPKALR